MKWQSPDVRLQSDSAKIAGGRGFLLTPARSCFLNQVKNNAA
jgi:hypothetical protein